MVKLENVSVQYYETGDNGRIWICFVDPYDYDKNPGDWDFEVPISRLRGKVRQGENGEIIHLLAAAKSGLLDPQWIEVDKDLYEHFFNALDRIEKKIGSITMHVIMRQNYK